MLTPSKEIGYAAEMVTLFPLDISLYLQGIFGGRMLYFCSIGIDMTILNQLV